MLVVLGAAAGATAGAAPSRAQTRAYLELFGGSAYNLPVTLRIAQGGAPVLRLTARYDTRGFEPPVYYALRVALGEEAARWEVELIHQKLRLRNRPLEVQRFEITHGYHLLFVNHARLRAGWGVRAGAGVVLAHPESIVRGRPLDERAGALGLGYYLTGPALQVAGIRHVAGRGRLRLRAEVKLTAAYAQVPVAGGSATAPNVALHGLVGIGYRVR